MLSTVYKDTALDLPFKVFVIYFIGTGALLKKFTNALIFKSMKWISNVFNLCHLD